LEKRWPLLLGGRPAGADCQGPEIHHVALSFKRVKGDRLAPGQAIECIDEQTAIVRAELMIREKAVAGAVAFSRRASADFRSVERAVILKTVGIVPKGFDIG
jgi:hypothetical protein